MNTVHILVEGYAHANPDGSYAASPSSVLIETEDKKILVDPGTNSDALFGALRKLSLDTLDVSAIYLTHYHPDHFLNIRLFPEKDIYDGGILWREDQEIFHKDMIPGTNIQILPTPGHSPEHTSLLVETEKGMVCVAQDVFWWEDGKQQSDTEEELMNLEDPFATDVEALKKSRQLVLEKADWIIPGHGKMFHNPRKK
jgi:glyoxylase-like metal-dependent hydrolase (beta-lactamase superfamily II)